MVIIGLGNVGEKLSKNLLNKKNKLYLFDKDKRKYLKFKILIHIEMQ